MGGGVHIASVNDQSQYIIINIQEFDKCVKSNIGVAYVIRSKFHEVGSSN